MLNEKKPGNIGRAGKHLSIFLDEAKLELAMQTDT